MITLLLSAFAAERVAPDLSDTRVREAAQIEVVGGLLDAGLPGQALDAVAQVRASGTEGVELDLLQARAMLALGLRFEAAALLEEVTRRHRRSAEAFALLGVTRADVGDLDGAVAALTRASKLRRDDPQILNNLGYAHMAKGELEAAVRLFRASLAADPSEIRPRNNLGFALARLERDEEALEIFRTAGGEADARYNLGVACELRSDRVSAIANYQAAAQVDPGHPAAGALARLLSQGTP